MANDAKLGMGTTFTISGSSIPGVESCSPISRSKEQIDSTNFGSGGRQFIQGMESIENIDLTIQYKPGETTHDLLQTAYANGNDYTFTIAKPFGSTRTATFTGKVVKSEESTGFNEKMLLNVSIAVATSSLAFS